MQGNAAPLPCLSHTLLQGRTETRMTAYQLNARSQVRKPQRTWITKKDTDERRYENGRRNIERGQETQVVARIIVSSGPCQVMGRSLPRLSDAHDGWGTCRMSMNWCNLQIPIEGG